MRTKQNAVSRIPYPWSVGKKKDAQKASLSTKLKKKETPLFLLGKDLIKLLLGWQKLCHKNFIKPFAPLPMVTEAPSNKNYVFVRQRMTCTSRGETILYTCTVILWVLMVTQMLRT